MNSITMADQRVAPELTGAAHQAWRNRQSTNYCRRVGSVETHASNINKEQALVGDVIFLAFSPIVKSNIAGVVFDGPTVGLEHVANAIKEFVVNILAANRDEGAVGHILRDVGAASTVDNITFLKMVLDKAVLDGDLARNTRDIILKSAMEGSGERYGLFIGDRSMLVPYNLTSF